MAFNVFLLIRVERAQLIAKVPYFNNCGLYKVAKAILKDGFLPQGSHLSFFPGGNQSQRWIFYDMNKNSIRVVKRKTRNEAEKMEIVANAVKNERKFQIDLVNAVNDWISERRTNSRREKIFSDRKISEWKILP